MTTKQRIAKAEDAINKSGTKNGAARSTLVRVNSNGTVTADGVTMPLAEFEKLKSKNDVIVRVGIDLDLL